MLVLDYWFHKFITSKLYCTTVQGGQVLSNEAWVVDSLGEERELCVIAKQCTPSQTKYWRETLLAIVDTTDVNKVVGRYWHATPHQPGAPVLSVFMLCHLWKPLTSEKHTRSLVAENYMVLLPIYLNTTTTSKGNQLCSQINEQCTSGPCRHIHVCILYPNSTIRAKNRDWVQKAIQKN